VTLARFPGATAVLCAAVAAGCGLGPGDDSGEVELTITRDYGARVLEERTESIDESDTVLRVLDRSADLETRYGGGFVRSIDGLAGSVNGGRRTDWFFYVNGIESPVGSAEYDLSDGDRVWWDHHDWTSAMRVPAVVGSWPEPFAHGFEGDQWGADARCLAAASVCGRVSAQISDAAAGPSDQSDGAITVLVGVWERIRSNPDAGLLDEPPSASGVFATFTGERRPLLTLLNERGEPAGSLGRGAGLVAALRPGDGPPTWVVTGADRAGVRAAAALLGDDLGNHFAVATDGGGPIGVPVR
jgi:Domain of unknown function (DUF4430)